MRVGITGHTGFIGYHLKNTILYKIQNYNLDLLGKADFKSQEKLQEFTQRNDVIVHLAGINRDDNEEYIFEENIDLTKKIIESAESVNFKGKVIFASSTQFELNTSYARAKKKCTEMFLKSSKKNNYKFTSLIIPNVFGPFCKPNYNSFIATFSDNLLKQKPIKIDSKHKIPLIYVDNLIFEILDEIESKSSHIKKISPDIKITPKEVGDLLKLFHKSYLKEKILPKFNSRFEEMLFYTFISYINIEEYFPISHPKHEDNRGFFSEIIRLNGQAQFSFSTTNKDITRGDHFHTRKIERFTVIKGEALIKIRKIGTKKVIEYKMGKSLPSSVDMFPWHTHNIQNIGNEELITLFSINEHFDNNDPDTYHEKV